MNWIRDRWNDLTNLGSGGWLAIAAWAALVFGIVVLVWASRQLKRNRQLRTEQVRPQVTMFMEPHPSDWHVIELVVSELRPDRRARRPLCLRRPSDRRRRTRNLSSTDRPKSLN